MAWGLGLGGCDRRRAQMGARFAGAQEFNPRMRRAHDAKMPPGVQPISSAIVGGEPQNHGAKDAADPASLGQPTWRASRAINPARW